MTRSPVTATLLTLVPLAALGWPLALVLNRETYVQPETEQVDLGPLLTAELYVQAAHPYEQVTVTIGETQWTYQADDDVKEVHYPRADEVHLTVEVTWPDDTPESALKLTMEPAGRLSREHTLWGLGEVREEITFTWDPRP